MFETTTGTSIHPRTSKQIAFSAVADSERVKRLFLARETEEEGHSSSHTVIFRDSTKTQLYILSLCTTENGAKGLASLEDPATTYACLALQCR